MWERIGSRRCHVWDRAGTGASLGAEGASRSNGRGEDRFSCTCALTGRPARLSAVPRSGTRFLRFRQNRKVGRA